MKEINTAKKIGSSPWEYTLYEVNETDWVINIPYSPVSFVDTNMSILLTAEEKRSAENNELWAKEFSEKVRQSHEPFLARKLDTELATKIYETSKG